MGQYRATEVIHRGLAPAIQPGEIVPATFTNIHAEEEPFDFDRLLELGVIEPANARPKAEPKADTAPADPAPDGADAPAVAPADAPSGREAAARRKAARKPKS